MYSLVLSCTHACHQGQSREVSDQPGLTGTTGPGNPATPQTGSKFLSLDRIHLQHSCVSWKSGLQAELQERRAQAREQVAVAATRILASPEAHLTSLNFLLGLVSDPDAQVRPAIRTSLVTTVWPCCLLQQCSGSQASETLRVGAPSDRDLLVEGQPYARSTG